MMYCLLIARQYIHVVHEPIDLLQEVSESPAIKSRSLGLRVLCTRPLFPSVWVLRCHCRWVYVHHHCKYALCIPHCTATLSTLPIFEVLYVYQIGKQLENLVDRSFVWCSNLHSRYSSSIVIVGIIRCCHTRFTGNVDWCICWLYYPHCTAKLWIGLRQKGRQGEGYPPDHGFRRAQWRSVHIIGCLATCSELQRGNENCLHLLFAMITLGFAYALMFLPVVLSLISPTITPEITTQPPWKMRRAIFFLCRVPWYRRS